MRLLVLGGTLYLGRHLVEAALARGHAVTLFNRGRTAPGLFPGVERRVGDRDGDVSALGGGTWDAVVDTSGYLPRQVRATAGALGGAVGLYLFISTISTYADPRRRGLREEDALATLAPGEPEELSAERYGALKAACERIVLESLPQRACVVRPGLIMGPHDPTDRSACWPRRLARGGEVLAPGRPERPVQLVDVRDLAEWMVGLAEARVTGVFNATGPAEPLPMGRYLETCRAVGGREARFTWVDDAFLLAHDVAPTTELSLWAPAEIEVLSSVDCGRARAAGLAFRPLAETLRDVLEWDRTLGPGPRVSRTRMPIKASLEAAREAELLAAWKARPAAS